MQTSTFQRGHRPNIHTCGFLSSILCIPGAFAVDRSDHGNELFGIHGFADRVHDLRCAGNVLSRTRVNWQHSLSVILGAHYEICNICILCCFLLVLAKRLCGNAEWVWLALGDANQGALAVPGAVLPS